MRTSLFLVLIALVGLPPKANAGFVDELNKWYDETFVEDSAPFAADSVFSDEYKDQYAKEICNLGEKPNAKARAACDSKLVATFLARLSDSYSNLDPKKLEQKCTAYPVECRRPRQVEEWARNFHNEVTNQIRDAKLQAFRENRRVEQLKADAERQARIQAVLGAMADGMRANEEARREKRREVRESTPLRCTTSRSGFNGDTVTNCNK